jgi:hypothetical protein
MPADYIPQADAAFDAWLANFETFALSNLVGLGLVAGDVAPVTAARVAWVAGYTSHVAAQNAAQAARQTKDAARQAVELAVRPLVRRLQASPSVDNAERAALGITVPDSAPTPAGPPTTRPVVRIDSSERQRHTLHFADAETPNRKARPPGVQGVEIWVHTAAVGTVAPVDPASYRFETLDTRTPHVIEFDPVDAGKNAHYILRWVNTRGEKGPWSETATATIGA